MAAQGATEVIGRLTELMQTVPAVARSPRIANHLRLGCSTGFMEDQRGDWPAMIELAESISIDAVELAALSEAELPGLVSFLADCGPLPFQYVSVHGPAKQRVMEEQELVSILEGLAARVDVIVVHPDTLEDLGLWRRLGRWLAIENMDSRKPQGRSATELETYFENLPDARLCFDIAHAWTMDPSMEEAERILDTFGSRLRHVHVSSLDDGQHHVPLTKDHEALFAPYLDRCRDVPWILEAPLRDD